MKDISNTEMNTKSFKQTKTLNWFVTKYVMM